MSISKAFEEIYDYVKDLEIIDTHEHLPAFESLRETDTDVLKEYLSQYFNRDLISAGLSLADYDKAINNKLPLIDRWALVEPYWEAARNTGYARALEISVKGLYGVESISRDTIEHLNKSFMNSLKPGHYRFVLKEKSKIRISLLHDIPMENEKVIITSDLKCDQEYFRSVYPVDACVFPQSKEDIELIESQYGKKICCINDWLEATEIILDNALQNGAVALKSALAYDRSLLYKRVTKCEAEEDFNAIFKTKHMGEYMRQVFKVGKNFQDYMMHFVLQLANRRSLVLQIHTGLQEGSGNMLSNSDPSLLSNLFLEYPDLKFDLFHMGYPYQNVVSALAKNFQNVYIDMCWAHIISPHASINALMEWIDAVPLNKISAFGGDYLFVDAVFGHQYMARMNVSNALAKKVEEGVIDTEWAKKIANQIFYENPCTIFSLEKTLK
ncbi:MAG: amidohydrolase family protein [Spirochaetota bacterium]|nr:MAG: amidohydrolase family protein [Spirochaetota bacterium]